LVAVAARHRVQQVHLLVLQVAEALTRQPAQQATEGRKVSLDSFTLVAAQVVLVQVVDQAQVGLG
jgi:hypothetical protein